MIVHCFRRRRAIQMNNGTVLVNDSVRFTSRLTVVEPRTTTCGFRTRMRIAELLECMGLMSFFWIMCSRHFIREILGDGAKFCQKMYGVVSKSHFLL